MTEAENRASRIESGADAIVDRAKGVAPAALLRDPGDGWSGNRVLAHVAEILPYWAKQVSEVGRRVQDGAPFGRVMSDPSRIAAVEDHANDDPAELLSRIRAGSVEAAAAIRGVPAAGWQRTALHAGRGMLTLPAIVDFFLVDHLEEHLKQLDTALAAKA